MTPRRRPITWEERQALEQKKRFERQQQENDYYEQLASKQANSKVGRATAFILAIVAIVGLALVLLR